MITMWKLRQKLELRNFTNWKNPILFEPNVGPTIKSELILNIFLNIFDWMNLGTFSEQKVFIIKWKFWKPFS